MELVLDVTERTALRPFLKVIKKIVPPLKLMEKAKKLNLSGPKSIRTPTELENALLDVNWAELPTTLKIPSQSQIFGHIAYSSGIQAILYASKFTGKECLGIFPQSFENKNSTVNLADEAEEGVLKELSAKTWGLLS